MHQISVIIPLYNKEATIRETIESVLGQNHVDFEIIVVDDGSTDSSAEIVKSIEDSRIKYFYKKNAGVSAARNSGVQIASGNYILFLDADDILIPDALKLLYDNAINNHADISNANHIIIDEDGSKVLFSGQYTNGIVHNPYKAEFYRRLIIAPGATLIKKSFLQNFPYRENLSRYEDLEISLRMYQKARIICTSKPTYMYRRIYSRQSHVTSKHESDYIFSMDFDKYPFWGKMLMGKHLLEGIDWAYPQHAALLRSKYAKFIIYYHLAKVYWLYSVIRNKLFKTFSR